jgi:HSP20 family molecular chaperone IbpA
MNVNTKKTNKEGKINKTTEPLKTLVESLFKIPTRWDDFWNKSLNKFTPADIWEDDENVYIKTATPGLKEEDIEISIEGNTVVISGKTSKQEEKNEKRKYFLQKLETNINQRFDLPNNIDTEKTIANYKDGVITVTLPKIEKTKTKKIPLKP